MDFLKKFFRYKQSEFEADMYPTPECTFGGKGEAELKTWSDGSVWLEISLKHAGLEAGSTLEVHLAGERVTDLTVQRGYTKKYLKFEPQEASPKVGLGDEATLTLDGQVLYHGQFRPD